MDAWDFIPTFHFVENSTKDDAARRAIQNENGARYAQVEMSYIQSGSGQRRIKKPVIFTSIFRTEPHYTCGSAVVKNPSPHVLHDPVGSAGVWAWQTDDRGFYTGAYIWCRADVEAISSAIDAATVTTLAKAARTRHHFTFSAVSFKDIPTDKIPVDLQPRYSGLLDP